MQRDLHALANQEFDLVVVGGGIFGICAAWDAVLRGLSVALVEQTDFAHAASANCFKIVHGGIRYLQHADVVRVRQSTKERNAFLRMAPHLVRPLPIVVPTYGHGMKGREILGVALRIYDALAFDRSSGITDPTRRVPRGRLLSRREVLDRYPDLNAEGLTGGVVMYDGHMYSPQRLAISILRSAVEAGCVAANYVAATGVVRTDNRVTGVRVRDRRSGDEWAIRGRVVLNAGGPWTSQLLDSAAPAQLRPQPTFSRDAYFVVGRRLLQTDEALAISAQTADPDAVLSREARHLFLVPWRDCTLVGVWHKVHEGAPGDFTVTDAELQSFLDEVNAGYPGLGLTLDDVTAWYAGLVLFGENAPGQQVNLSYGKRSRLVDHARADGVDGLISLVGVRYTTARAEAWRAIDLVGRKLRRTLPRPATHQLPVHGGQIDDMTAFQRDVPAEHGTTLPAHVWPALLQKYGSEYGRVLAYAREHPAWATALGDTDVVQAEVIHAIREEMAQTLGDVVFRRTELGTGRDPGDVALDTCADLMAQELAWDPARRERELAEVCSMFRRSTALT